MITLRTLKKKSLQAMPYVEKYYKESAGELFIAERGDNYHGLNIKCPCPERADRLPKCNHQSHPLAGTPMVGKTSGYYEPEWEEETAFEFLYDQVIYENKPKDCPDKDWKEMMRITGISQQRIDENTAWIKEGLEGLWKNG